MAPNLPPSKRQLICDMIESNLKTSDIANAAECSKQSVRYIRSNLRMFGSPKAPPIPSGRPKSITLLILEALCHHLSEHPGLYLDEMACFLREEYDVSVASSTISRALATKGWSKKTTRNQAEERNADLRDYYLHNLSEFKLYHLVYVDESGCDKRIGYRRTGWAPLGVTPVQVAKFHRGQRYQILPAYCQDGVLFSRVFRGSTDASIFENFIGELLHHCGRWSEPKSVLVMDNASFHHSERIECMCLEAGVKLVYLPPYSPDLNPIEEFFAELKAFIKRNWQLFEDDPDGDFEKFLEWCIDVVGAREESAEGHFRRAGLIIEHC